MAFYLLYFFQRIPLNVQSPEEVCVPVCQMLSCLDKQRLKQTKMSHSITGFHIAWFCKRSFHIFNALKSGAHIQESSFFLFFHVCLHSRFLFTTVHKLPGLPSHTFSLFLVSCVMNQCRYRCFSTCLSVLWINTMLYSVYAFKLCAACTWPMSAYTHTCLCCRINWILNCT